MAERKLVVIKSSGILPELNGIQGPVNIPTRIPVDTIVNLILNRRSVWECYPNDPYDEKKRIKLTVKNAKTYNFGPKAGTLITDKIAKPEKVEAAPAGETPTKSVQPVQNDSDSNKKPDWKTPDIEPVVTDPGAPAETPVEGSPVEPVEAADPEKKAVESNGDATTEGTPAEATEPVNPVENETAKTENHEQAKYQDTKKNKKYNKKN